MFVIKVLTIESLLSFLQVLRATLDTYIYVSTGIMSVHNCLWHGHLFQDKKFFISFRLEYKILQLELYSYNYLNSFSEAIKLDLSMSYNSGWI